MKNIIEILLRLNVWLIFSLSVFGAVLFSVFLGFILNSLFYDGTNNLLMLGSVVIPFVDAPVFIILLIVMINELRISRQQLDMRVQERTDDLKKANDALKQEIKDREDIQSQLIHAQKMESVGRLAGGVAHDYNNILSVIIGFSEMALEKVRPEDPLHEDLQEIYAAARRSSDITRQLLAFARKEVISPEVIDLNVCVESMLKILRRLIGEDIDLAWLPRDKMLPVLMDRSQLEQILANLCVNARDAIVDIGNITIETDIKIIGEDTANKTDVMPGEYVILSISDNGQGMDLETQENVFEPFFTTKGVGKGTGLGLATVHGIVRQNDGFIYVYSALGEGTVFKIYLPKHEGDISVSHVQTKKKDVRANGETILVVEDDISILKLTERILINQGYKVIKAGTPSEALEIFKTYNGKIDLLITDVVMPGMNGKELSERLKDINPSIKCLYMSGYTANIVAHKGILDNGIQLIQKPFSTDDLTMKIKAALE